LKLISTDKFRSVAQVNNEYDMIRVKIDMPLHQWKRVRKTLGLPYTIPKPETKDVGDKIRKVVSDGGKGVNNMTGVRDG